MTATTNGDSSWQAPLSVAEATAEFLASRGVDKIYGLCGGHIIAIWDAAVRRGIQIVDVRDECAAVYMAHAAAELTGRPGVALVTAGPGLTNAVTGIANAAASRTPVVVISGRVPRPQAGMGGLQDIPQAPVVAPLCRRVEVVSERHHVLPRLDAVFDAAAGIDGPPGPAYIDFPTDLLRETISDAEFDRSWLPPRSLPRLTPDPGEVAAAAAAFRDARRPLVIAGRGARQAAQDVVSLLDRTGALYLDTAESRGAVPVGHPSHIPAMRGRAMQEADLVVTLERRLDFQLAYGSRAVFAPEARFVRIGRHRDDTAENRRGDVEVRIDAATALHALLTDDIVPKELDGRWRESLLAGNAERAAKLASTLEAPGVGSDGRMHPYALIAALNDVIDEDTIVVVDGGDILSFARVALSAPTYLDPGPLGCLGVGVPFATSAALNLPGRRVVALIGDGSFGFTAMEIDTAVRTRSQSLFIVANNESWNIERHDLLRNYDGRLVGVDLPGCRYDLLARAFGAYGERVETPEELPDAIKRALSQTPAVLDVLVTRDAVSPDFNSGLAGVPDRHALVAWDEAERRRIAPQAQGGDEDA
jgi:acetolactate synthase I/II/III large subunit